MVNIWDFISNLFDVVINIGQTIWRLLTTPIIDFINNSNLPSWITDGVIGDALKWLFKGNINLLTLLPVFLGIFLIIRVAMLFTK